MFPHRLAPEKLFGIFKDLAKSLPQFKWVICLDKKLSKSEYHTILGESALVFSANLQETFGISCIEGLLCGAVPLVPDRLSYTEIWNDTFKYPDEWTRNYSLYQENKNKLIAAIDDLAQRVLSNDSKLSAEIEMQYNKLKTFISAKPLVNTLLK